MRTPSHETRICGVAKGLQAVSWSKPENIYSLSDDILSHD